MVSEGELNNLLLSELSGHYTSEDFTDYGLWFLTIETEAFLGKMTNSEQYDLETTDGIFEIRKNPVNGKQLMFFLPETFKMTTISTVKIMEPYRRTNDNDIFIETVYITKEGKD